MIAKDKVTQYPVRGVSNGWGMLVKNVVDQNLQRARHPRDFTVDDGMILSTNIESNF